MATRVHGTARATGGNRSNFDNDQYPPRAADGQGMDDNPEGGGLMDTEIYQVTVEDLTTDDIRAPFEVAYLPAIDCFAVSADTVRRYPDAVTWLPLRSAHLYGIAVQFTIEGGRSYTEMTGHAIVVRSAVTR